MLWNTCFTVMSWQQNKCGTSVLSMLKWRGKYTDLPCVILVKLLLSLIPSCVLCILHESGGNVLKTFLRVCYIWVFHGSLCLSCKPNWFGKEKLKIKNLFLSHFLSLSLSLFSDLHLSRAQSCSLTYLAGSPEIIAKYSWQVSDKACWCSARVLDGQICCDWGHICGCCTISCLSAILNKLLSSEQARTETVKVCSF